MFRKGKKITAMIVLIVMVATTAIPTSANMGGYLNNLVTQMKGLAPKAYEGQERGYFVGGSASVRWGFQDRPLVSFTPPSLKVGCSGIDIVMGGFSYLNFEHLVQKLQAILAAAPGFAFRIALKTLCEACDNVLASLENISTAINSLNVDSCQASKAIGAWAGGELAKAIGHDSSSGSSSSWFASQTKAIKDATNTWKTFIKDYAGMYDCASLAPNSEEARKCLEQVGRVSFLAPLMAQAFGKINTSEFPFEGIFRARYGDVYQDKNEVNKENIPKIIRDPGCYDKADNNYILIDGMVSGQYKIKTTPSPENAGCADIDDPNQGLEYKVGEILKSLTGKIKSGATPDTNEINLINAARIPIYRLLSLAILVDRIGGTQEILTENFVDSFKRPIAYDIAWSASSTVNRVAKNLLDAARAEKDNLDQNTVQTMQEIITSIGKEIDEGYKKTDREWQILKEKLGELTAREVQMKATIYQELAKNKLLDSYVFAKGLR